MEDCVLVLLDELVLFELTATQSVDMRSPLAVNRNRHVGSVSFINVSWCSRIEESLHAKLQVSRKREKAINPVMQQKKQ